MMKTDHVWNGVRASVYQMNAGDKIVRHRHSVDHTTHVIRGLAQVDIFGSGARQWGSRRMLPVEISGSSAGSVLLSPEGGAIVLPKDIDHEITARSDDTIVVNLIDAALGDPIEAARGPDGVAGVAGGIIFE